MNKLKIYLSQPMTGKTKEQILEEREPYMKMYGGDDCEFINSVQTIMVKLRKIKAKLRKAMLNVGDNYEF